MTTTPGSPASPSHVVPEQVREAARNSARQSVADELAREPHTPTDLLAELAAEVALDLVERGPSAPAPDPVVVQLARIADTLEAVTAAELRDAAADPQLRDVMVQTLSELGYTVTPPPAS